MAGIAIGIGLQTPGALFQPWQFDANRLRPPVAKVAQQNEIHGYPLLPARARHNKRLNFNRSFENGGEMAMAHNMPLRSRFLGTAVLISAVGGLLLSYQWVHLDKPTLVQVTPASPAMMQLLRDEHGLMATMFRAQLATEKQGLAADGTDRDWAAGRATSSPAIAVRSPPAVSTHF